MCQPQCRDEERCAENHSSDHNSALETIQMPSFWEHSRLDVLHHDKASRDTEASHGRGTERPPRRQAALQGGLRPGRPAASPNSQRGFSPPMSAKTMIFYQEKNKARPYSFRRFRSQLFTPPILRPSLDHRGRRFVFPFATMERLKNVRQTSPAHPPKPVRYGWGN